MGINRHDIRKLIIFRFHDIYALDKVSRREMAVQMIL